MALKHSIDCGGWCPADRLAEDGIISAHYPLRELPGGSFADRTRQNVHDSDATVIFCRGEPRGGTAETIRFCGELLRPHLIIDANETGVGDAAATLTKFVRENAVEVLNVAGPRASDWPDGYDYACSSLELFVSGS